MSSAAQAILEAAYAIHHKFTQYQSPSKSPEPSSKESEFSQEESVVKTTLSKSINNCLVFKEYESQKGGVLETMQKTLGEALTTFEDLDTQLTRVQLNIDNTNSELNLLRTQIFNASCDTNVILAQATQKIREMDLTKSILLKPQSSLENLSKLASELEKEIAIKEKIKGDFEENKKELLAKYESIKESIEKYFADYNHLIERAQVDLVDKKEKFQALIATESKMVNN